MAADTAQLKEKCKKTIEAFKKDLTKIRTGRASANLLEGITVDYYGTMTPLIQLANISVPEARIIALQVYDRGAVEGVMKAIRSSDLGLNPSNDGNTVRVILPSLSEERRKELIKKLKETAEEARVALRNNRRETIDDVKEQVKDKAMNEDESKKAQEEVQKITDLFVKEVETLANQKEKEMLEV
ncbi:MAG: ribosome recycling factor [bacterium]|nr:ribosome recycling factor [bacterium]